MLEYLDDPQLVAEIAEGLSSKNAALVGDRGEVFTEAAEESHDWVVPYAELSGALLSHRMTRVRREAMRAPALLAPSAPALVSSLLATLAEKVGADSSIIVRD